MANDCSAHIEAIGNCLTTIDTELTALGLLAEQDYPRNNQAGKITAVEEMRAQIADITKLELHMVRRAFELP